MIRVIGARRTSSAILFRQARSKSTTSPSSSPSPLEGDSGNIGTHTFHKISSLLALATPFYFFSPDSVLQPNGAVDKACGLALAASIGLHSWTGLNYVVTDYVPKVSKAMVGPARVVSAGIGLVTLVGLGKVALNGKGGIKATILTLWRGKKTIEEKESA